ncbi:MAG: ribonuclease III, partial [Armatimonadetes bacterium]|nr:ribonuclease III [Armatimonadota bacterium]
LEFLGDSVLGMLVNEYLYREYPDDPEGALTKMKARIVCEPSLADAARRLGLGALLALSPSEEAAGGRERPSTLSDAFEAVVAALYLHRGLDATRRLVRDVLIRHVDLSRLWDHKSHLQELMQERYRKTPTYRILEETGPAHDRRFVAEVLLDDRVMGRGTGRTKKAAEQAAAAAALASEGEPGGASPEEEPPPP